jgi:phosphate:Na+ symporter
MKKLREKIYSNKKHIYTSLSLIMVILMILSYRYLENNIVLVNAGEDFSWRTLFFELFGGLGIFLYGINLMGDSLKLVAGKRLKVIIEKTTKFPIIGIFIGILVTGLIQSSSGTTALTVGLVRAGLMTLPQAVGIILGANIGTTITSILIGLKIKTYALPIIAVGAFLIFFFRAKKAKNYGGVFLGFGMLFFGLSTMEGSLKILAAEPGFISLLESFSDIPILGVIVGALTTALVQSSSATIGIVQGLYSSIDVPTFDQLKGYIAIVLGDNIGTTITAVLASIGGSVAAKRAGLAHVMFNLFGAVIFTIIITPYTYLIWNISVATDASPEMTISFAHMFFNIINTIFFYFFINQLVWLVKKIIPGRDEAVNIDASTLDPLLIDESPSLALEAAKVIVSNMGDMVSKMLAVTINYSFENNSKLLENGFAYEEMLDTIDKKSHDYLVRIASADLELEDSSKQAKYVDTIRDFERIGDHCTNILQFFEMRYEDHLAFSKGAEKELKELYEVVSQTMDLALKAFNTCDKKIASEVLKLEDIIDRLVIKNRKRHIFRINDKISSETQDGLYIDILSNVERIGDHCNNIAVNILQDHYYNDELEFIYITEKESR